MKIDGTETRTYGRTDMIISLSFSFVMTRGGADKTVSQMKLGNIWGENDDGFFEFFDSVGILFVQFSFNDPHK